MKDGLCRKGVVPEINARSLNGLKVFFFEFQKVDLMVL